MLAIPGRRWGFSCGHTFAGYTRTQSSSILPRLILLLWALPTYFWSNLYHFLQGLWILGNMQVTKDTHSSSFSPCVSSVHFKSQNCSCSLIVFIFQDLLTHQFSTIYWTSCRHMSALLKCLQQFSIAIHVERG